MPAHSPNAGTSWWAKADAYLRWAADNGFAYANLANATRIGLLAESATPLAQDTIATLATKHDVFVPTVYGDATFFTATIPVTGALAALDALVTAGGAIRLELATPVAEHVPGSWALSVLGNPMDERVEHLVGVIDDGCAFADQRLRLAGGRTRMQYLWDQDAEADRNPARNPFHYGTHWFDSDLADFIQSATVNGTTDEDAAYGAAGLRSMRAMASHGAYVLGLAADAVRPSARISASRFEHGDATSPPTWARAKPPEGNSNDPLYAFVQIPRAALDDPTGRWLGRNVLDGLLAILRFAAQRKVFNRVTINVSYGPQTGPHDGSSLLERAIDELVERHNAPGSTLIPLAVTLPSGNSRDSQCHGTFELDKGAGSLEWRVAPDSRAAAFLEVWLPQTAPSTAVEVTLTSPAGERLRAVAGDTASIANGGATAIATEDGAKGWNVLFALDATGGFHPSARPPHGRWVLSIAPLAGQSPTGTAHAFVARNDVNFGGRRIGEPGYLWHRDHDRGRGRRWDAGAPAYGHDAPAQVSSSGTLSGLATGKSASVVGGYRASDGEPAPYGSEGPSRDERRNPDCAFVTDESKLLPGIRSWGNRSGNSVRLIGTSAAAPQCAWHLDRGGPLPSPTLPSDPRTGRGKLP